MCIYTAQFGFPLAIVLFTITAPINGQIVPVVFCKAVPGPEVSICRPNAIDDYVDRLIIHVRGMLYTPFFTSSFAHT